MVLIIKDQKGKRQLKFSLDTEMLKDYFSSSKMGQNLI